MAHPHDSLARWCTSAALHPSTSQRATCCDRARVWAAPHPPSAPPSATGIRASLRRGAHGSATAGALTAHPPCQGGGGDGTHHAGQQLTPHPFIVGLIAELLTGQRVVIEHPCFRSPIRGSSTANLSSQAGGVVRIVRLGHWEVHGGISRPWDWRHSRRRKLLHRLESWRLVPAPVSTAREPAWGSRNSSSSRPPVKGFPGLSAADPDAVIGFQCQGQSEGGGAGLLSLEGE